jgi:1,4-dihydroxy-6-naphthoate synthase
MKSNVERQIYSPKLDERRTTSNAFTLGFSPCPNDTFMFDAMVNSKIDTNGLQFNVRMEDVQTLNLLAINGELDITKISFAAYPLIRENYELLTAGSALGNGVGPLFISKKIFSDPEKEIKSIAIPGKNTTANFLFRLFYPELSQTKEMIFSDIEQAIIDEKVDAGVIIHENRFTYESKGLKKISDLGELWENKTGLPIPLGGIVVRRNLDKYIKRSINNLIRQSVEYAFENPESSREYVAKHAQEMSEEVRKKHIKLYVNNFSKDLGEKGIQSVSLFLEKAGIDKTNSDIFINQLPLIL